MGDLKQISRSFGSISSKSEFQTALSSLIRLGQPRSTEQEKHLQNAIVSLLNRSDLCSQLDAKLTKKLVLYLSKIRIPSPLILAPFYLRTLAHPCRAVGLTALPPLTDLIVNRGFGDLHDFFPRLYQLIDVQALSECDRLSVYPILSQILLSSLIPTAWIGAFAKRCARQAVLAVDESVVLFLVTIVYSVLQKNAALRSLLHADTADAHSSLSEDPFSLSDSLTSAKVVSLWEIELLITHMSPAVARLATLFKTNLFSHSARSIAAVDFASIDWTTLLAREKNFNAKKHELAFAYLGEQHQDDVNDALTRSWLL